MKTRIFIIVLLITMIILPAEMQAQVKLGLHGSVSLQTQAEMGQLWNNCELYPGYMFGGTLEYGLGRSLSFQTELNYEKKGAKVNTTFEGAEAVTKREFNYLTVPLLIRETIHDPGLGEKWDLTFFAGPYGGYLVSAKAKTTAGSSTEDQNIEDQTEKSDFGAIFGGGVRYNLSNGASIYTELRYEMGLAKIDKQDPDLRNKSIGITIGYRF
jgi:hypothetical protein